MVTGECWRCNGASVTLYRDPLFRPGDPIPVCYLCAVDRNMVAVRYARMGKKLRINFTVEHP